MKAEMSDLLAAPPATPSPAVPDGTIYICLSDCGTRIRFWTSSESSAAAFTAATGKPTAKLTLPATPETVRVAEYSEGICGDGAAILKDGQPMTISEIVSALRLTRPPANEQPSDEPIYLHLSQKLIKSLKRLSFAAQTSGGTAGRDEELIAAIAEAEQVMGLASISKSIDANEQPAAAAVGVPDGLADVFAALFDEMETRSENNNGDAPGHSHDVPGIWDRDNGKRAGKPCAWCALWRKGREMRNKLHPAQPVGGDK